MATARETRSLVEDLRESRPFVRRQIAARIVYHAIRARCATMNPEDVWVPDDLAKFAEDTAQALVRRLAAREDGEIDHGFIT